jgi:hypothetical protein
VKCNWNALCLFIFTSFSWLLWGHNGRIRNFKRDPCELPIMTKIFTFSYRKWFLYSVYGTQSGRQSMEVAFDQRAFWICWITASVSHCLLWKAEKGGLNRRLLPYKSVATQGNIFSVVMNQKSVFPDPRGCNEWRFGVKLSPGIPGLFNKSSSLKKLWRTN